MALTVMRPSSLNGINYLNRLLGGGEQGGEVLGVMVLAHSPKAPGRWVPWACGSRGAEAGDCLSL